MKRILFFISIVLLTTSPHVAFSEDQAEVEIEYLLSFVAESGCVFIRNGTEHQSREASKHLMKKYNYAKSRISSPELFVSRIASRSSMTKKAYVVRCEGEEMKAGRWLTDALIAYRGSNDER
jgi:hypothetical protein